MKKIILVLAIAASASLSAFAVKPEPLKEIITPILAVPSTGEKLTFRFIVRNDGDKPSIVYGPFANETHLRVVFPDGEKKEIFNWKEMDRLPDPLQPGKTVQWDIDISQRIEMKDSGWYRISFSVNDKESNQIIVVKD